MNNNAESGSSPSSSSSSQTTTSTSFYTNLKEINKQTSKLQYIYIFIFN